MLKIVKIFLILCFATFMIFGKTVKFEKELKISEKSSFGSKLSGFIFGKKRMSVFPNAICVLDDDRIAVADSKCATVFLLNGKGEILKKITKIGKMSFGCPVSLCKDNSGNIYMSDSYREGIVKISPDFKSISLFASIKGARTTGLAMGKDRLYCIDTLNHKILCFDMKGQQLFSFGKRGVEQGQFNYPTHIAYKNGELFIVDAMNFRVQIFSELGVFIKQFGKHGDGGGNFSKPKGIAVDDAKRVFVTDVMFDNVQIFSSKGDFLCVFGVPGSNTGQFWMPFDIDIFKDKIYVADTYNKRIQVFKIEEGVK